MKISKFIWPFLAFIIPFIIYALTTSPEIFLEDDGLFILSGSSAGYSHPPGYPLFNFLGYLFTKIPISTMAFRFHMFSGFLGSLVGVIFYYIGLQANFSPLISLAMGLSYCFSRTLWSQAIITEVYTLNTFLFFLMFLIILKLKKQYQSKVLYTLGAIYGLSLCNHWPLIILSSPGLFLLLYPIRKKIQAKDLSIALLIGLLSVTVPYILMIWRSQSTEFIFTFLGPIKSLSEFIDLITRKAYQQTDHSSTAGNTDRLFFIYFYFKELFIQFTPIGFTFILIGLVTRPYQKIDLTTKLSHVLIFLGSGIILIFLLDFDYDYFKKAIFRVYPHLTYGIAVYWCYYGVHYLIQKINRSSHRLMPYFANFVIVIIPILQIITHWHINNRSHYKWAENYGRFILDQLPEKSILLLSGDIDTSIFSYLRYIQNYRSDIDIYHSKGSILPNRILKRKDYEKKGGANILINLLKKENRPIFFTKNPDGLINYTHYGLFKKITEHNKLKSIKKSLDFLDKNSDHPDLKDIWTQHHLNMLYSNVGEWLGMYSYRSKHDLLDKTQLNHYMKVVQKNYYGTLATVSELLKSDDIKLRKKWLPYYIGLLEHHVITAHFIEKIHLSQFPIVKAVLALHNGEKDKAITYLKQSKSIYPNPQENESYRLLKRIKKGQVQP